MKLFGFLRALSFVAVATAFSCLGFLVATTAEAGSLTHAVPAGVIQPDR